MSQVAIGSSTNSTNSTVNFKQRGQRIYLYRSRWVRKAVDNPHGYATQEYVGSLPSQSVSIPDALSKKLSDVEVRSVELRVCQPARSAARLTEAETARREADPLWRLDEAARLLCDAAERSQNQHVSRQRVEAILAQASRILVIDSSNGRPPAIERKDRMLEALNALRLAAQAVREGAYGNAPAEGVRSTRTYALWADILEAVTGERASLLRALQSRGFAKAKGGR